ncbi:MAG: type I restriction endonuclease subunit R, partial [Synergistaceae bacterium]|nr:type I restriction endonuclease subunit R [Synergistaceae bacterium]
MSYNESEYENTFINFLESEGWQYLSGKNIPRSSAREVLYVDDTEQFLSKTNPDFTASEILELIDSIRLIGAASEFATLHKFYGKITNGVQFTSRDGIAKIVSLIDFDNPKNNIFRVVNQFTVEYTNNGQTAERRPDVLLFVNGLPLCIIELKNPSDEHTTIYDAWEQIYIRYWRDIPHLLHYCVLACISDGAKTRLGTVRTPYEHFYAWRRVNDGDKISTTPFEETENMVKGVFSPERFLEIIRDYVYFQDSEYDSDEFEIVCRYPQFFAARLLKQSIINSLSDKKNGKGGTYFGATGCGKTYTMAFLARQLSLRAGIGSPTIVMIVDRDDLQKQGAKLFTKSKEFLNVGEVSVIKTREHLRSELKTRDSGGFYICTIQKFCDRQDDKIGLSNNRRNIICFSDEAHRTQLEHSKSLKLDEKIKQAILSKPYAEVLREAFPNATFVGFTGTPIEETYQTFGSEIDRYTMDQAVADGLTVSIKYHPRISRVLLDDKKVAEIEEYYQKCADDGATTEDIAASKKAMSSMEIILGEPSRLERLAVDIHDHYLASCENDPERVQKAMIVCSNRKNAYNLLKKFRDKYPEWFEEKKAPEGLEVSESELRELKPMPFIAMITSVGSNDDKEMYDYLGGVKNDKRSEEFDAAFKQDKSNFHVAIVVDMWLTGFDVPSLTYMYNDKPLKKHMLIQTISRVNRKYPGKEYGLIVDYIGIRDNMREAVKLYGGDTSVAYTEDDEKQAENLFREELFVLKKLFSGYDLTPFLKDDGNYIEKYKLLSQAAEYVFSSTQELKTESKGGKKVDSVIFKTYFLKSVKRMRAAYDICQPSGELDAEESSLARCFMAIAGLVRKMNGTSELDTETMNRNVAKMVEEALKYNKVESVLEIGSEEDIFSPEYVAMLSDVKMPASKLELLIKTLKKQIAEYSKTNQIAAKKFRDLLEDTIKKYHERRKHLTTEEAGLAQEETSERIINDATKQALK